MQRPRAELYKRFFNLDLRIPLGAGDERFAVAINPCIMYLECIDAVICSFLDCIIVLPLVVLYGLLHAA